jgi:hypothetical protein
MLQFLLTQKTTGWILSEATDAKVVFKPVDSEDELAAIEFHPRKDKPSEKVMVLLKGKDLHPNGQEIYIQRDIDPGSYLDVASSIFELIALDVDGFDL